MTIECNETQDTLVQNLLHVDEFGIGVFNYDILEHLTSKDVVDELQKISEGYNLFNVKIKITEYFSISFIRVIDSYGTDLKTALRHENYDLIDITFKRSENKSFGDFFYYVKVLGHLLGQLGLNVALRND